MHNRQSYFFPSNRAQSDGRIVQIRKVNKEGLGRGRKKYAHYRNYKKKEQTKTHKNIEANRESLLDI